MILRADVVLPPSAGPARAQHCISEGLPALNQASYSLVNAWLTIQPLLIAAARSAHHLLPEPTPSRHISVANWAHAQRVLYWRRERRRPLHWIEQVDHLSRQASDEWLVAESAARQALSKAVEAFYWFDDVLWDYPPDSLVARENQPRARIDDLAELAHRLAHEAGDFVGGLFGCWMQHEDEVWYRQCQLTIMHNRLGQSPGLSVRYVCNICRKDPLDCAHLPGSHHQVIASSTEAGCSICRRSSCEHEDGTAYDVQARVVWVDPVIHEVSVVPRPKDPLARFTMIEVDRQDMLREMGQVPAPGSEFRCYSCLGPCRGLRDRTADPLSE